MEKSVKSMSETFENGENRSAKTYILALGGLNDTFLTNIPVRFCIIASPCKLAHMDCIGIITLRMRRAFTNSYLISHIIQFTRFHHRVFMFIQFLSTILTRIPMLFIILSSIFKLTYMHRTCIFTLWMVRTLTSRYLIICGPIDCSPSDSSAHEFF